MKLSFKNILPILLICTLLILFAGCAITPSPGYTPGTISGIIAAPCCSTSTDPVTEPSCVYSEYWCCYCENTWSLQDGIEVILTYGEDEIATVFTNEDGEYTFTNVESGKNYVITAFCPDYDDDRPLVKDVALEVVEGETFDAKITDCVSTSLGLVVDFLVTYTELGPEDIVLDPVIADQPDFWSFPRFKKLVIEVCRALAECGNLSTDEDVQEALCEAAEEVGQIVIPNLELGCGPGYTPPTPTPGACDGNVAPIIDSVSIDGTPVAINAIIDVVLGNSYEITVTAHDPDNKLGTLTYYASANGVESPATTSNKVTITPTLPGTFTVYVYVHDGCVSTSWGPVTVKVDCCPLAEPGITIDISKKTLDKQTKGTLLSLCLDECATINSVTVKYVGADPLPDLVINNLADTSLTWSYNGTKISFNKTTGEVCLVGGLSGTAGTYKISVTYTDPCGKTASGSVDVKFIDCSCQPPTADAGGPYTGKACVGANALVNLVGTGTGTDPLTYAWDLDNDGQFDDSAAQNPQNISFSSGTYTVSLKVTNACGFTTDTATVTIANNAPPTITSTPTKLICPCNPPNTIYTYNITATDTDSADLNFVLVQYPANMTITKTGPKSATISWAANCTESQKCWSCTYNIKIKVSDECSEVFQSYILQVKEY